MSGVFFLDFDGPFYPNKVFLLDENKGEFCDIKCKELDLYPKIKYWKMDAVAVAMINNIYKDISAFDTVISSSWSHPILHDKHHIEGLLKENDMNFQLHNDWRTDKEPAKRVEQIALWLSKHPEVKKYIILDDVVSAPEMVDRATIKSFGINPNYVFMIDVDNGISMGQYQDICRIVRGW